MPSPATWRATPPAGHVGPHIVLVHGLAAGNHMERHLLKFMRDAGHADTTLYSNYTRPAAIARDVAKAAHAGRPVALIGYSQGGFQLVKVAHELAKDHVPVDLLVTVAAGGAGRLYFPQIGANPRRIPGNVKRCLNYYVEGDWLGTDPTPAMNLAKAESAHTHVENTAFPRESGIDHVGVVRCYPPERVHPLVKRQLLDRLLHELAALPLHPHGAVVHP